MKKKMKKNREISETDIIIKFRRSDFSQKKSRVIQSSDLYFFYINILSAWQPVKVQLCFDVWLSWKPTHDSFQKH